MFFVFIRVVIYTVCYIIFVCVKEPDRQNFELYEKNCGTHIVSMMTYTSFHISSLLDKMNSHDKDYR